MSQKNGAAGNKPDLAALRAEIAQTRAELGETVQALAAKADVKARAREQVEHTKARMMAQASEATGRVREAAQTAGGKVRGAAHLAGDGARSSSTPAYVRNNPIPLAVLLAGVAAVVGVILIVRGRRR